MAGSVFGNLLAHYIVYLGMHNNCIFYCVVVVGEVTLYMYFGTCKVAVASKLHAGGTHPIPTLMATYMTVLSYSLS